jgi:hypothetical protein
MPSRTFVGMVRRALPAMLVAVVALADALGDRHLALYALLGAVPALAVAVLAAFGDVLEGRAEPSRQLQTLLSGFGLLLVVAGATVRAPAVRDGDLPPLAVSTLVACLVVLALEAALGAGRAAVERPARRRGSEPQPEQLREAA